MKGGGNCRLGEVKAARQDKDKINVHDVSNAEMDIISLSNVQMSRKSVAAHNLSGRLRAYRSIMYAIVMHDIKSRFFGNGFGQIVMLLWPFIHIIVLLIVFVVSGRVVPFGTSAVLYSATGVLPFIVWSYPSRWIVYSALQNRTFLNYPIIKPLDISVGRMILEAINTYCIILTLALVLILIGVDITPAHPLDVFYAIIASFFLACGFGLFFVPLAMLSPFVAMFYTFLIVLGYMTSGILFVASNLPTQIRYYASLNPVLHLVEWMRYAYYDDYPTLVLDRTYVLIFGFVTMTLGLILERLLRRFI